MSLKLVYYGHPALRKKAEPVAEINDEIRELVAGMHEIAHDGLGLAANQVGKLLRVFIFRYYESIDPVKGEAKVSPFYTCINPRIIEQSTTTERAIDGCLSIPDVQIYSNRPNYVKFEAQNLDGETFQMELKGYNARIFFHENDHLDGVLNIDHLSETELRAIEPQLKKINKKYNKSLKSL